MDAKQQTREFIKQHPKMSYTQFKKHCDIKINECYYYAIRREIFPLGPRSNAINKSCVYLSTASISTEEFLKDPRKGLIHILNEINNSKGLKLEALEHSSTKTIEIRQIGV